MYSVILHQLFLSVSIISSEIPHNLNNLSSFVRTYVWVQKICSITCRPCCQQILEMIELGRWNNNFKFLWASIFGLLFEEMNYLLEDEFDSPPRIFESLFLILWFGDVAVLYSFRTTQISSQKFCIPQYMNWIWIHSLWWNKTCWNQWKIFEYVLTTSWKIH